MSRLIDADVAEKTLRAYADEVGCHRGEYELANGILKAVCYLENIPTAYELDKIVEQLEEFREEMEKLGYSGMLTDMIEIVKGGGVDE